jgi:hypothetical protein
LSKLPSDSSAVKKAKSLIENPTLKQNLAYLYSNTVFLADKITALETKNTPLADSIAVVNSVIQTMNDVQGENGSKMKKKFMDVLQKKPRLEGHTAYS